MKIAVECPVCGCIGEDGGHLFFKCKLAKHIWRYLNLDTERQVLSAIPDAYGAVEWILKLHERKRELIVIALWFIWSERNCIREEGRQRPAAVIARCIELYAHENVMQTEKALVQRLQCTQRWVRPPHDMLKLNCDGSFHPNDLTGSWVFLIRDSDGEVVMTGRGRVNHLLNAFQAELVAVLQGLQTAVELGIGRIILETDAQEVVRAMNTRAYDESCVGVLIEEIKSLASLNFISFQCVFISRSCNEATHEFAKLGYLCTEGEEIMPNSLPENIAVLVANDLLANE